VKDQGNPRLRRRYENDSDRDNSIRIDLWSKGGATFVFAGACKDHDTCRNLKLFSEVLLGNYSVVGRT
jgi:hypothetical protein